MKLKLQYLKFDFKCKKERYKHRRNNFCIIQGRLFLFSSSLLLEYGCTTLKNNKRLQNFNPFQKDGKLLYQEFEKNLCRNITKNSKRFQHHSLEFVQKGCSWKTSAVRRRRAVRCGHFADTGGFQDMDIRTFWLKNFGFFEMYGVCARTRREGDWTSAGIMRTGGSLFLRFYADVFYGRSKAGFYWNIRSLIVFIEVILLYHLLLLIKFSRKSTVLSAL